MNWPLSQDYNEAVQNPATSLGDPELKQGHAVVNSLGLPIPRSGNFADVYEFVGIDNKHHALKCFTRPVGDLQRRYAAIDEHLSRARLPFTVGFRFHQDGVRIRKQWYPLLQMEWVEGFTLNEFLRNNLAKTAHVEALFLMWVRLAKRLRVAEIAHGDLQHGNVLLVPGSKASKLELKLIDYDGMWVPALAEQPSGEMGHANYQHPLRLRLGTYSADVDRFPHLVVACALRGLVVAGADLWKRFDNGDNLLFRESDLKAPRQSELMRTLWDLQDPVLCPLLGHLVLATRRPLEDTPWLDELLVSEHTLALTDEQEQEVGKLLGVEITQVPTAPVMVATSDFWLPASPSELFAAIHAAAAEDERRSKSIPLHWIIAGGAVLAGAGILLSSLILLAYAMMKPKTAATEVAKPPVPAIPNPGPPKPPPDPTPIVVESLPVAPRPNEQPARKFEPITQVWSVPGRAAARCLDFSRDGRVIVASTGDSLVINFYQTQDGRKRPPAITLDDFHIRALATGLIGSEEVVAVFVTENEGAVWNLNAGRREQTIRLIEVEYSALAISPDGRDLICPAKDSWKVIRIGLDTGMFNNSWKADSAQRVIDLRYGVDGKQAVAVDDGFRIAILDLANDDIVTLIDSTRTVRAAVLSPDGSRLAAFGRANEIRIWDTARRRVEYTLAGHTGGVADAVFTRDGRILSVGADAKLRVWDASTGKPVEELGLPYASACVRLSPDGKRAVTASASGGANAAIQLWQLAK